ncbi:NPCBM/NEW2 domain-containing protein [Sporosarcina sp. NPDC096371]|uniref:NPCBM/NEW2 domain-containing protein n=1 Tax=Sporosarcina sp. NPDC096371 TaxID=3364530 RepID=UPI00380F9E9C
MKVVKIVTAAAMTLSFVSAPLNVLADQHQHRKVVTTLIEKSMEQAGNATVSKFSLYGNDLLHAYNETFKMANDNITSITNNGGNYAGSPLDKAIDGDMNTHWETGKANHATFTNEVVFHFNETTSLNRIVYAARQAGAKGKGFAQAFEIYGSTTDTGDDFTVVSSGDYKGSTGDIIEIQFKPTEFKRLKFVYKKADQDWASASEFLFYKEDTVSSQMENLFTDKNKNQVSEKFNTVEKLTALEESVKSHPLYAMFKEDIENAFVLIKQEDIEATEATTKPFEHYSNEDYSTLFRMDKENIRNVRNNAGHYGGAIIGNVVDRNLDTYWETNKSNAADFSNEVEVTFKEAVTLNRIMYGARASDRKGFAEEFEIYASQTSTGDTYQLVSTGQHNMVAGLVEAKFEPTHFKRIKFKFKKSNQNWASLSELAFYKEDVLADKMANLFTDDNQNKVSEPFNTLEKLEALEQSVQSHPLYEEEFKENLKNAKALIEQEDIEATEATTKPFEHYSNEDYSKLFRMDKENIQSVRNNAGHYGGAAIGNVVDGNLDTYWETNKSNAADFSNEVEVTFQEAVELNRIMYGARPSDRKGFAEEFEIYASQTSTGDTYQLVSTGQHNMVAGLVEAKFKPTTFKRVKFKFKKSNQNWATLSELAFYKEDVLAEQINDLFTNGLMNELKPEFASMSIIHQLEAEVAKHPLREQLQESVNIAKDVLNNVNEANEVIVTASQRGNSTTEAREHQIARTSFSLETFARYVVPGETIQIFVDADEKGVMPNLVLGQIADDKNGWHRRYSLHPGLNTITAPSYENMKPAVIYVENAALPSEQAYAPKVRLIGGTAFPVYDHGKTDPAEYERELEEYVAKISVDDNDFANGKAKDVVYNVTELISENNTISTSAAGALKGIQELEGTGKTVSDTMDEWEIMWTEFQKVSGYKENEQSFNAKFTSRVFTKGPYGWSDWGYTGYNGGNSPRRDGGFFKQIVKPFSVPGNDGWAYYHEWAHNINNSTMEHTEVTNNIYSVIMRKIFNNSTDDRVDWNSLYKRFAGEKVNHGYWTYLGVLEQVQYYYGEDSYGKASRIARTNPDGVMDGLGSNLQRLVIGLSLATETDLTAFFEDWGYVTATDKMKEKVAHLPKPDVKLEYMHSLGRSYEGAGFSKDAQVLVKSLTADKEKNEITLTYDIDIANKDASMGYEILRDGEVVGYTTSTSFVDKNVDTNGSYIYEIVAYDKKLKRLKPVEVKSQQPRLSVEEHLTLKLHQEFNPMNFVKASSYQGNDITEDVIIKSNNVDVTKKGDYEIVYEVKNAKITQTKTTKITVVSDFAYISDMDAKQANIAWGGLKKDLAPAGSAITLVRQGLDATYSKGIGAHANSEVVYDIDGKGFDFFESSIGIDQAVKGRPSSATFEVWVDGEKKFSSDVFKADTEREFVKVPVTGAKEVKLITTDAKNNGNASDHTVWADAKFTIDSSKPILTVSEELTFVKLNSDFDVLQDVEAFDAEDGNLIEQVKVTTNGFDINKTGTYTVEYTVIDSDDNIVTKSREIYVYSDATFASDTNWNSAQTAWKTVNKDKASVGESIKLLVNGETKEFAKGIGTHASSEIVYDLEGRNYDYFETLVGVDRNIVANNKSSVTFKILADGEEVYNSGVMNYNTEAKLVRLPVKDVKNLTLIASDSGNGNESDHADFADAKFYISNGLPQLTIPKSTATKVGAPIDINEQYSATDAEDGDLTAAVQVNGAEQVNFDRAGKYEITYTVTDSDGNEITKKRTISVVNMDDYHYLSDFDWKSTQNSYTVPTKDISISAKTLRLTAEDGIEVAYEKGIGAHSNSTIVYDLTDKDADYFTSFVGVDRQMYGSVGSVVFQVYVDGEMQFDSGLMNSRDPQKFVEVNISGAQELKLVVTDGGNGNGSDHATWGDAKLHFANADRVFIQDLEATIEEAKAINVEDYTPEAVVALQASIKKAEEIIADKHATQTAIDQAVELLQQAIDALVVIDLSQVISVSDKDLSMYIKQTLGITDEITLGDMYKLTSLSAVGTRTERITNLEGLQYAKNLVTLDISGNEVTDFSPLQGLEKLENLNANPQIIEMPSPPGQNSIFDVENLVKGLDGKHVNPTQIAFRHNQTFKEVVVNVDQLEANADQFSIDLTEEDKGVYTLVMVYEVEGNFIQIISIIDNH